MVKETKIAPRSNNDMTYNAETALSTGHNVLKPEYLRRKSREDIIEAIRSGVMDDINVGGIVAKIRKAESKETRKRLKLTLPWFSGGIFFLRRCLGELKQTNFIIIDIDDVEDPEEMKLWLELVDPSLDFAFTSPSNGLKLVYRLLIPIADDISYMRAYRYLADDLLRNLGLRADEGAKSRAQACYFSHDPDLWENPQCKPLQLSSIPSTSPSQGRATVYDFPKAEKPAAVAQNPSAGQRVSTFDEDYATAQRIVQHLVACGEISYDHWRKTAYAIKARFGEYGREIFLLYAQNNAYHDDRESLIRYWDSLGTPTSVSFPSLVWVAKQYGWQSA